MLVQVLQEAAVKMHLDVQETYWGKHLSRLKEDTIHADLILLRKRRKKTRLDWQNLSLQH